MSAARVTFRKVGAKHSFLFSGEDGGTGALTTGQELTVVVTSARISPRTGLREQISCLCHPWNLISAGVWNKQNTKHTFKQILLCILV